LTIGDHVLIILQNVLNFAEETREIKISIPETPLQTPKPARLPLKTSNIKESSDSEGDEKFEEEINTLLARVEKYRMIGKKELNSDQEMMNSIMEILVIQSKSVACRDKLNEMLSSCEVDDNSKEMARLTTQLNTERLDNKRVKRRMKELENKLVEEQMEKSQIISKQAESIRNLEDNLKRKDETINRLKQYKLDQMLDKNKRESVRANPIKTVDFVFIDYY